MEKIFKDIPWLEKVLSKIDYNDILLLKMYDFYHKNNNFNKILHILMSTSAVSIRIIDWFVTNYSKKYNIIYELDTSDIKYFNVYFQYKCILKAYKKKLFDPFCRNKRIAFYYEEKKCIITTLGQLNFFKWAITYNIIEFVEKNIKVIINDMNNLNTTESNDLSNSSETIENKKLKKRHLLSINANKTIKLHIYDLTLNFD